MNSVDLVKSICKKRGIAISKLERDCGFSNGYIRKLKEGKFPSDRMAVIAKYLNITIEYLMTGNDDSGYYTDPATAKAAQDMASNSDLKALYDVQRDMTPDQLRAMYSVALALKGKEEKE